MSVTPQQPAAASEVRLTDETIAYLKQITEQAVANGIKAAINKETATAFWSAGFEALQENATQHAGRFVLGGMWGLMRRLSMFVLLGGVVYAIGGWSALAKLWHALWGTP